MTNNVTMHNVYVGMPVQYYSMPDALPFDTQVITAARKIEGVWCVNVAMVGEPVPLNCLVKMQNDVVEDTIANPFDNMTFCTSCNRWKPVGETICPRCNTTPQT